MKRLLASLLLSLSVAFGAYAQTPTAWPDVVTTSGPKDFGNGPLKIRVISGIAYLFTSQGSGLGSTAGSSTSLTLTATPPTATKPIVGARISGSGITEGTTVAAYNGTTGVTLSAAMTVPASTALAWGAACPATVGSAPYISASASADYYTVYSAARVCGISPGLPAEYAATVPYPEPGGSSSLFNAPFPTYGTAAGMSVGGNMVAFTGTAGNLNVQCANCTGSGASAVDQAAFTAGASVFAPGGGFFQTTPTANPLTNGKQGMQQYTAQRAGFVNLRDANGTEIGTAASPLTVQGSFSASSSSVGTPGATVPASADYVGINVGGNLRGPTGTNPIGTVYSQQIDLAAVSGSPVVTGHGTASGAIRVELPSDGTGLVNAYPNTPGAWGIGAAGSAVPTSAGYTGVNVAGTLRGATASNPIGTVYSQQVDLAAVSGSPVVTGHGTAAGAIRVELPTDGTGSVNAVQSGPWAALVNPTTAGAWGVGATGSAVPTSGSYTALNVLGTLRGATGANPYGTTYAQNFDLTSVGGAATVTGHGTAAGAIRVELPTDGTGSVNVGNTVNVACTSGCTASSATTAGTPGQTVPVSADYIGVNVGGTIRGATAVNPYGTVYSQHMDLTSVGGSATATGSGTALGAIRVELPTNGTGLVNANPGTDAEWGLGAIAATVPGTASYTGINVAGNLRGPTGTNPIGTVYSQQVDLAAVSGSPVVTGHGTAAGAIRVELPTDGTGSVNVGNTVNVACTSGCTAGSATTAGTPGQAVPVSADYVGINVAGNIRGATGVNPIGSVYATQTDLASVSGSPVVTGHGTAAGAIRVELPTDGTGLVTANPATAANWGIGATGSSVPANAAYGGINVAGTMRGATGTNPVGTVYSQQVDLAAVSGAPVVTGHGTAAGAIRVELPTDGTGQAIAVGAAASGATASGNPVPAAGLAVSSETLVSNGQAAALITDLARKLITLPYANPENFVSGVISTSMTSTTVTQMIASPGGSLRNYITSCQFSNAHASQGTDIYILDGSDTTKVLAVIPAAATYGGATVTFPVPLRQTVTTTAAYVQNVTTGASTKGSCQGFKGG